MTKALIFNMQKFSIHDGPGIRTTIFFKGCPLKCLWCSNPESQDTSIQILYDQKKCVHCMTCLHTCPNKAIQFLQDQFYIDTKACSHCLTCVHNCINQALSYEGEYKTIDEIIDFCLQDVEFYEESNGGVTLSGGEALCQPQAVHELCSELKKHKIHIAVETTGYIESQIFQESAALFDLLLFDVKHYDSNIHQKMTGVSNEKILKNLSWALNNNIEVLVRIPVIPGFNAEIKDAKGFVSLFQKMGIKKVQLLPFHQFGQNKYSLLNREYAYKDTKALYPEDLQEYQNIFTQEDIDCFF